MKCVTRSIVTLIILTSFHALIFCRNAYAYLDPGTGSYILQIIIAAILGGIFMVKPFFKKIKDFLKDLFPRGKNNEQSEE